MPIGAMPKLDPKGHRKSVSQRMYSALSWTQRYEVLRKAEHFIGLPVMLMVYKAHISTHSAANLLFIVSGILLAVEIARIYVFKSLNDRIVSMLSSILRPQEMYRVHSGVWYFGAMALALTFFPKEVAVLSVCLLTLCDPIASVGGRYSRLHGLPFLKEALPWSQKKSYGGAVAALAAGFLFSCWWFRDLSFGSMLLFALVAGFGASFGEAANDIVNLYTGYRPDDNLMLPLTAGAFLMFTYRIYNWFGMARYQYPW